VLWPPPKRGESVTLACGCAATVIVRVPIVFLYWIRIRVREPNCRRSHAVGSNRVRRLEDFRSLSTNPPTNRDASG
jgi:hypothetical protein